MIMRTDISNRRSILFKRTVVFCLFVLAAVVPAEDAGAAAAPKNSTRITSDKVTYDTGKNHVVFEGRVHVIRPTMEIRSELLTVLLDDSGKKKTPADAASNPLGSGGGKVDRIIAERNVRITQENKVGTCGKATYFVTEGRILMDQDPVIIDGESRISGKTITYYTETGRSVVTSDPKKPVEVIFPTDDSKSPNISGAGPSSQKAQQ